MDSNGKIFAQDEQFWNNYLKGRPHVPDALFNRIFDYHRSQDGLFGTVHDVGAGNGPYAQRLRTHFDHVIVSDVVADNVELARTRLAGNPGFSFRVAKVEEADDLEPGSVDMVFATNVMHFPDPQDAAMAAVARQLRPGGTFVAALFAPARFDDVKLQDLWERISYEGGRQLLKTTNGDDDVMIRVMARTQDTYNVAPLDSGLFEPGAQRVHLNMSKGGIPGMLPPEQAYRDTEPSYTGPQDVEIHQDEEGWSFTTDLAGVKEHFGSFPFVSQFPDAFVGLYKELDELLGTSDSVTGYFPVKIILATRIRE